MLPASPSAADMPPATNRLARVVVAIARAEWHELAVAADEARAAGDDRARLDETLLQATLFFGFPRVVTAFEHVAAAWPRQGVPASAAMAPELRANRGRELFAAIYGKNDAAVRDKLHGFHPEFHDFVLEDAYGRILSRSDLDVPTRELLAVTALAALTQIPQLTAHARGALKFGASPEAIRAAMRLGGLDETQCDEALRRAAAPFRSGE